MSYLFTEPHQKYCSCHNSGYSCDFKENAVIREQTDIFTDEIREKNKDMQSLANQLKVAQEQNKRLELMLLCREDQINEKVDQAKRDSLKENPILISINKTPEKSNKAQKEREELNQ